MGGSACIEHSPVVLEVEGGDVFKSFERPGLVLNPIDVALPLQALITLPPGEVAPRLSGSALVGEPTVPIDAEVVPSLRLLRLLSTLLVANPLTPVSLLQTGQRSP